MKRQWRLSVWVWVWMLGAVAGYGAAVGEVIEPGGMDFARASGEVVNLRFEDGQLRLYCLDAERKVVEPTVAKAVVQLYESPSGNADASVSLRPVADGYLTHPRKFVEARIKRVRMVLTPVDGGEHEVLGVRRYEAAPGAEQ